MPEINGLCFLFFMNCMQDRDYTDEQIIEHLDKYSESKFMGCYLANESYDDSEENLIYNITN